MADTDEREQTVRHLRESEARFRAFVVANSDVVYRMSPDWGVMEQLDGVGFLADTQEPSRNWLMDYIPDDERARVTAQIDAAIRTKGVFELEHRVVRADGTLAWTLSRAVPVLDDAGEIREWIGSAKDVTERKRVDEALRESEERFQRVVRATRDIVWDIDLVADRVWWSEALQTQLGFAPDEIGPGTAWCFAHMHPDDRERVIAGMREAAAGTGSVWSDDFRYQRADGTYAHISDRASITRDASGRAIRMTGAMQDVTARERAETTLRESEERLRAFGNASQDILWIRDAGMLAWTYLTPAFEEIYGLSREEALHGDNFRNWMDLIVPEDRAHARDMIARVLAGEHVTFEYRIRRPHDGEIRWLRNTDFPMRDERGRVTSLGGIGQDVTSLKAAEERLTTSEERLRSAAEVARFALWDWDVRTGKIVWSDEHFRMEGYGVGEVTPSYEAWVDRVHPDDRADTEAVLAHARDTRTEYIHEFRSLHRDGSVHWLSARGRFFYDQGGDPVRMIGAMLETTERREWEERQNVMIAELQHRTRNLIAVVGSIANQTMDETGPTEAFRDAFADRLAALSRVQGLLSRSEAEPITIGVLMRLELDAIGVSPGGTRVTMAGPEVFLKPSTVQTLALALHELATNARKYGALSHERGHLAVTWRERVEGDEHRLVLDWSETGREQAPDRPTFPSVGGGYGRELIEHALPHALGARTSYALETTGVRCAIDVAVRSDRGGAHHDDGRCGTGR